MDIPIEVWKPDGNGPFPAVVVAHDCSGLGPSSSGTPRRWAEELRKAGFVAVLPDSFTPRDQPNGVCTVPPSMRNPNTSPRSRAEDARVAMAHARSLPFVDGRRVGLMGGSHGGATTLATMISPGFAAGIALYPSCPKVLYRAAAPVLILAGEKDDWTPAEPCRQMAESAQAAGFPVTIKIYPGAHHGFDSPYPVRFVGSRINPNAPGGRGATTGGDPAAWADSIREVLAFFRTHLQRPAP